MNKRKLVRIIVKDLEEIKILSEEVAESQEDSTLIIDLALNKARLICQEIELLREISRQENTYLNETEEDLPEDEDDEVSNISISDPELEILNFEEQEFPEEETDEQEEALEDEPGDDEIQEDQPEPVEDEIEEDDLIGEDEDEDDQEENDEENPVEDGEDDLTGSGEDEIEEDKTDEDEEVEEPQQKTNIQVTELKNGPQPGVREIHIDDLDDEDDFEPMQFSPLPGSTGRPVMHEIPKPENQVQGKTLVGESFQKERSLNDVIGENKSAESKLTNGPIPNLRAAIGLNDRYFFIREIFDNDTEKYNTVIEHLDKLETIQEAVGYLKANLSLQKSTTSLKFVDLLKRRFNK